MWRNGSYVGVLLVALGAALWGTDAILRVPLLEIAWGGSALATLLFTTAFALGNPTVVILLQKTQPLFAIALDHLLLRERLRPAYWPCFAVAVLGAYLISFGGF